MIGEMLVNRYEILEKVGDGGMALVYRAKDHLLSRIVAVKILRAQFADDEQFVERFRREARSAASLSHPNIVNIYDVGEIGDIYFIVMEFVQGKNLHDLIRENSQFSQKFIVNVGKQIAMGLSHAHYHGIIHRDIKPHNILITKEGQVKVTDFGIAQAISSTNLTQTGMVLGSVHYFSPEQAEGKNVQAASDLYSLGIVLYELITGQTPFRAESPIAIALKQLQEDPRPLSDYNPDLDGELEALVLQLLNKQPEQRAASSDELVRMFQKIERRLETRVVEDEEQTMPLPILKLPKKGGWGLARAKKKQNTSRKKKEEQQPRAKWPIVLVILFILTGLGYGFVRIIPILLFPAEVQVPNVVGLLELEGQRLLRDANLPMKVEKTMFDNEVPAGHIISQDPVAGRMVKAEREILVRVSQGVEEVEMPDVRGLFTREAKLSLTQAGFVLGSEEEVYDSPENPNTVLEQWPEPGEIVAKGTPVDLVINKGKEAAVAFALPDFRGQDFDVVKRELAELGLGLGNSWPEQSTVYRAGLVVEQNPSPGTEVQAGWKIDFVYSRGQASSQTPTGIPETAERPQTSTPAEQGEWHHEDLWETREVSIDVPAGPSQEIVILVIDDFGAREVYRETHKGGTRVIRQVQGRGPDAKLQVYLGGRQVYDSFFKE